MSAINDLICQIENVDLRQRIQKEVERMSKQKKFGLVFEEHLPECTPLYDIPVKCGATVALKTGKVNDNFKVLNIYFGSCSMPFKRCYRVPSDGLLYCKRLKII